MTPAERQLVTDLFDRLATLEDAPRDNEAERAIRDGLNQAPNAVYALVQTTLVQDEALKRANARIQQFEAELGNTNEPPRQGGFLDNMRNNIFGPRQEQRTSVPPVRGSDAPMGPPPGFRTDAQASGGQPPAYGNSPTQQQQRPGGSFLGTAAAAAAGAVGGALMLDAIRGMMTNRTGGGGAVGLTDQANAAGGAGGLNPLGGSGGGNDDLARALGRDDLARGSDTRGQDTDASGQTQGLFGGGDETRSRDDDFNNDAANDSNFFDSDSDFDSGEIGGSDD